MVQVVIPERVQAVAALRWRANKLDFLRLVFADDDRAPSRGRLANLARDRCQNMITGFVVNVLRGVESQAIQMKFANPIAGVGDEEFTNRLGSLQS